jgi:tRNA-dihydrouridine synthase
VAAGAGIKEEVDIPVFCAGRVVDPIKAEDILAKNQADMVAMTRACICDPELPNKAQEGRLDEIRYCIGCNEGCWGRSQQRLPTTCALNPGAGREEEMKITPAPAKKKVMVIGDNLGELDAVVEGEEAKIAFNGKYLQDVLQVLEGGQVALEMTSSSSPGVLRPVGVENYVHVIMPMFVQW